MVFFLFYFLYLFFLSFYLDLCCVPRRSCAKKDYYYNCAEYMKRDPVQRKRLSVGAIQIRSRRVAQYSFHHRGKRVWRYRRIEPTGDALIEK